MLLHIQLILWKVFIEVPLEFVESDGVAVLMDAVLVAEFLKTVVCQVHVVVAVRQVVSVRGSTQVAVPIHEDFVFASEEGPHTDVELASFEKERPLDVFLDDATSELGAGVHEKLEFFQV